MGLPFLPEEIWEMIFSCLPPVDWGRNEWHEDEPQDWLAGMMADRSWHSAPCVLPSPALLSLSRTSKKFYRIAQPLIYRNITVYNGLSRVRLIRTLIEQPMARQFIRTLSSFNSCWFGRPTSSDLRAAHHAFLEAQTELGLTFELRETFARGLRHADDVETQQLLLVALCPRLERLDLRGPFMTNLAWKVLREVSAVHEVSEQPTGQLLAAGHLSRLRKLRLIPTGQTQDSTVTMPFDLPSLTALAFMEGCNSRGESMAPISTELALQHLYLFKPHLNQSSLRGLLFRHSKLRNLRVELPDVPEGLENGRTRIFELGNALREYGNHGSPSLESLVIKHKRDWAMDVGEIGSLMPLRNLKRLSLSLEDLVGDVCDPFGRVILVENNAPPLALGEKLPDSLEVLEVHCRWWDYSILSYFHYGVLGLISSGERANLRKVLFRLDPSYLTAFLYTKTDEHPGWTLTTNWSEEDTYDFLDGCPMVEDGYLSVEYDIETIEDLTVYDL